MRLLPRDQWPASTAAVLEEDVQEASPEDMEEDASSGAPNGADHINRTNVLAQVSFAMCLNTSVIVIVRATQILCTVTESSADGLSMRVGGRELQWEAAAQRGSGGHRAPLCTGRGRVPVPAGRGCAAEQPRLPPLGAPSAPLLRKMATKLLTPSCPESGCRISHVMVLLLPVVYDLGLNWNVLPW